MTAQIENHLSANMNIRKKDIIIGNFLGGISWGAGSVLGATVVIAVLGWTLNILGFFDFFKNLPSVPQLPR